MDSSKLYIIDEIGKMEMFSFSFEKALVELLKNIEKNNFLVLATVPLKSLKLSDMFKTNSRSKIFTVCF
jgi:nucleoside-triphosphatase THEP1